MSYELLGRFAVACVGGAVFLVVATIAATILDGRVEKWRKRVRWDAAHDLGARIESLSWWFDDAATRAALAELGHDLMKNANFDNDQLREAARKRASGGSHDR